jgi:hypothetical protein|tara:strand:+ start:671 stop:1036 length:366 start_codon:yes stop_codon:yes gene_type:complete
MTWFDILKTQYHVTSKDNVDSILREGIKPNTGGLTKDSVWTFNSYEDALTFASDQFSGKPNPVILEIEPDENIKFKRGPQKLVNTGGRSATKEQQNRGHGPGKLLDTSITNQTITGDIKVV